MSDTTATASPPPMSASQERAKTAVDRKAAKKAAQKPKKKAHFKKKELVHMFRGLASMLRAQINTSDALKYYSMGLPNKVLADTLHKIRLDTDAGISIHEAFKRTKRFDDMTVGLIQAGSDSGQLHRAFSELSTRIKSDLHFKKQVKKAVLMPSIVISVLIGAFIISQVKITPQVEDMLLGVGQQPDGLTAIAFSMSHLTQKAWPIVVLSLITFIVVVWRVPKVRNTILIVMMSKWRLLNSLVMSLRQMTFLSTMELLYSNGINLAKSIRVAANSIKQTPLYEETLKAADQYENSGVPLSTAFSKYTSVDEQVVHMLSIGERSASIDSQLNMLAEMYEEESESHMNDFTQVLNFLVLLIAVTLIGAVFVSTFLPIFLMGPKMMQSAM
ncbi:MAG: hypothetical protein HKN82_06740 [Akkermansiaceae bacterium]|nr:hypothetical protein [Akkermansiaceae bacterium]NNM31147.1 hypothetical protein [Akkermansiaceae bacterium]